VLKLGVNVWHTKLAGKTAMKRSLGSHTVVAGERIILK
jgi:hypothetical protein